MGGVDPSARVEVLTGLRAFDDLGAELDDLNAAVGAPVTAQRRWLAACAREQLAEPMLLAIRARDTLVAVAALATTRRRGLTSVVGVGHGVSDRFCLPSRTEDAAVSLADAIVQASESWKKPWRMRIEQLPRADRVARALSDRLPIGEVIPGDECPVRPLDDGRELDTYASSGLRKQVRAGRNRLTTDGRTYEVRCHSDLAGIEASLDRVRDVHRKRDHELGRPSDLDLPHGLRLWDALVLEHARAGEVEVVLINIDDELAAYGVVLLDGAVYRVWDARIDSRFGRYAPGHLLGHAMLEAALQHDDITCFDWGRGTESYKRLIAPDLEERDDLHAWSSSLTRRISEAPGRSRRRLSALLDRHPRLRRGWVWLKQHTIAR